LETVRANVLKKPFSKTEVENLVQESLKGSDAKVQQSLLSEEFVKHNEVALELIGDPSSNFTAMVFGKPKMGKSYHVLILQVTWPVIMAAFFM
jgi:hypothetical protein